MPQVLTAGETAILKSKIQAGASGHSQKVNLTSYVGGASTLRNPYYVSATLMPNGKPGLLFRAIDTPYTASTEKVYFIRYISETLLAQPVLLFPYNVQAIGIATYLGIVVAIAFDSANTRIRMRTSADNGVTWSSETTLGGFTFPSTAIYQGRGTTLSLRTNKAGTTLYVFYSDSVAGATQKHLLYRSTTNTDPTAGWSAQTDSGFVIPSIGRNYGGSSAANQGDTRGFGIVETKTAGTWVIAAESDDGDYHANHAFFQGTLGGTWTRKLNDGYGGGLSGGQGANGNVFLDRNGDVIGYAMSDSGDDATWWRSTDSGATWGSGTQFGPQNGTYRLGAGDGVYVAAFSAAKEFIWSGRAGLNGSGTGGINNPVSTVNLADLLVFKLSVTPVVNVFSLLGQGAAGGNIVTSTLGDVSDRVIAISFDKATQLDSDTFNIELANEDGALNINTDVTTGTLAIFAKPNVLVDVYQWHGAVANSTQTFHGIVDSVRQHDSPRTVVLTGRCGIKKLLVQEVRLIGGQDLKVAGYIRDTSNFVYLNKTLNEVLNHLMDYAGIAPSTRALAPSTFVFKELRGNDQETLMDLSRRACDVAGMEFWSDELGIFRSRAIGGQVATSSWTFRSYEDITVLDPDTDDDGLKTRVRVLGKANIGAKYLAEQFHWPGPETPGSTNGPAGIAYDKTTKTVWLLTQNSNLYRLDPAQNMAIVAGPFALGLGYPDGISVDPIDNNLWITDGFDASLGNSTNRKYKKINRGTQALMLGPFTNPDGDHCAPWAWDSSGTGAGPVRIKMTTYTSGKIVTMNIDGTENSRVNSPVTLPTALASDTGGGLYLTGWDAVDFYQCSFAGSITNTIAAPSKNGNGIGAVEDATVFDFGSVYEVWRDQNLIVKYAPTVPTGVDTATYAEVVNAALEQALAGEVRLARLTDLAITDKAQATVTAQRQLDRVSIYSKHTTVGVLGHPGIQKGDRVTVNVPGASINGDWTVISIRSDQNARSGSWLMVLVLVPYRPLAG